MLSRVAESIYWTCRYIERAENIARFINVNWRLMLDTPNSGDAQWAPLIQVTGDVEDFQARYDAMNMENVVHYLTFDETYPNSIISCLNAARENARTIREIIPADMWEQVNTFYLMVHESARSNQVERASLDFFQNIVKQSYAFIGITLTTMTHNEGWHFCRVGRMLERADKTSRILDVKYYYLLPQVEDVGTTLDSLQWSALLRSASALQAYRQRYGRIEIGHAVEYLLLSPEFPRSVRYAISRVQDSLHAITGTPVGTYSNEAERRCGMLMSELAYTQIADVWRVGLHEYVDACQTKLNGIGDAVFDTFFAIRPVDWAGLGNP